LIVGIYSCYHHFYEW